MSFRDRLRNLIDRNKPTPVDPDVPPPIPPDQSNPVVPPSPVPAGRKKINRAWLRYGAIVAALAVASYFGVRLPFNPTPPDEPIFSMGWVHDPDEVAAVAKTLEFPAFSDTPAGHNADPLPKFVYLWDAHVKVTGQLPEPQNQNPVGSCVSFGTGRAIERTLAVQVARGEQFEFKRVVEEVIYAGSRVDVGGGRLRGEDGSIGAWAAKYVTEVGGALPRDVYGSYNLSKYDPNRCRAWGDAGVPAALKPEVKQYPVGSTTQIRSWDEVKKALAQGYGIAVCSDQGFTFKRDSDGKCRPSGRWDHCMCIDGYHTDESGREWGHIENSGGPNAHTGPVGWGSPNKAGFWTDRNTINRMVGQGDTWAFSAVKGFPKNAPLDWVGIRLPAAKLNLKHKHNKFDIFALAY